MISGLNTSVQFEEEEFHVQTEDRGPDNPVIDSTIYVRGAVIGTKKTSYKKLLEAGAFDEDVLRRMLESQHYSLVRAIRSGRVTSRRRERQRVKPMPETVSATPHVELLSGVLGNARGDTAHQMRIRLVETFQAKPIPHAEVSVEIFGSHLPTQRFKGKTDADGYLNLKVEVPQSHRVAAAMLFRVDNPEPGQELKVLLVEAAPRRRRK